MRRVHLDHNATTPLRPEARDAWLATVDALAGNPSSVHASGRAARDLVDRARERVAAALGVREDEVVFTSGGTESNNLALAGALEAAGEGSALVTTAVEHSSVLEPARALERRGHPLTLVGVDRTGQPDLDGLAAALEATSPALVSIQAANNEIGTAPPLGNVAELLASTSRPPPTLHVDAAQALGRLPVELERWRAGLATFSAHKVGGPAGLGVLVVRAGARLAARVHGGGQERDLRPGTEDVAGIVAAATAIELAVHERETYAARVAGLTAFLWEELVAQMPDAELVGPTLDDVARLPNTLNVLLPERRGKVLVTALDLAGLEISAGSACASGSVEPSHVLTALGYGENDARSGLRLSLGRTTTRDDCAHAVEILLKTASSSRAS